MQLFSLGGLLVGMLIGIILAIWGAKKNQGDLGVVGLACCVIFGSIGGLILAIPTVVVFCWLIKRAVSKTK